MNAEYREIERFVPIQWFGARAWVHFEKQPVRINRCVIGTDFGQEWSFIGYKYHGGDVEKEPLKATRTESGFYLIEKATHAVFIKIRKFGV